MSRLAAQKEFLFMKVLGENGFHVPKAIAQNRHTIVMELVEGVPLRSVKRIGDPAALYGKLIEIIIHLAEVGLIHGDFNEFNIMVQDGEPHADGSVETDSDRKATERIDPVVIDFPQMVSVDHANAEMYFDRDINCIKKFFEKRFSFLSEDPGPYLTDVNKDKNRLDVQVEASGFSKKMSKELEKYREEVGVDASLDHMELDENEYTEDEEPSQEEI